MILRQVTVTKTNTFKIKGNIPFNAFSNRCTNIRIIVRHLAFV